MEKILLNWDSSGKQMGEVLSELLDTVLEDPALNTKEKLLEIAKAKYFGRFD